MAFWDTLFAQAASEGISVFVASTDSGAAACDTWSVAAPAYQVRSVNYICSSSYATCVGGTEFADTASPGTYWSSANGSGLSSALGYIPEGAWNDPTEMVNGVPQYVVLGTGGGASMYVPKPAWQTGTGVPADGARDLPDLAFPASGHDGYYACFDTATINCSGGSFTYFAGTSAAAPSMAGVAVLLNQKAGGRQGNLNPLLYRLAGTAGVFHDATPASSGVVNCDVTIPSMCNNSVPGPTSLTGGLAGFSLTAGYDQATGNGSLDVYNFLVAATASTTGTAKTPTSLLVTSPATSVNNNGSATFTATLSAGGTPTGTVQFYVNTVAAGAPMPLSGGKAVASLSFSAAGDDLVSAIYSGDSTYAASTAPGIPFEVVGAATSIAIGFSANPTSSFSPITVSTTVKQVSGTATPTGVVQFYDTYLGNFATVPLVNGVATTPAQVFGNVATHTVSVDYLGDTVYQPSTAKSYLAVSAGTPTITWPTPAAITTATALSAAQLDATANVAGTFVYTPGPGTVLPAGNQQLSVAFTPTDTVDYLTASASVTVAVTVADFSIALSPASATINAGQTATFNAAFAPIAGSSESISLACSGLPANAWCTFSPQYFKLSGSGVTYPITIGTNASALSRPTLFPRAFGITLGVAACVVPFGLRRKRAIWSVVSVLAIAILLSAADGCGGSAPVPVPRTPDGTYTVMVTATGGSLAHTASIALTVAN